MAHVELAADFVDVAGLVLLGPPVIRRVPESFEQGPYGFDSVDVAVSIHVLASRMVDRPAAGHSAIRRAIVREELEPVPVHLLTDERAHVRPVLFGDHLGNHTSRAPLPNADDDGLSIVGFESVLFPLLGVHGAKPAPDKRAISLHDSLERDRSLVIEVLPQTMQEVPSRPTGQIQLPCQL